MAGRLDRRGIRIDGLAELAAALKGIDASLADIIEVANTKAAKFVAERAQARAGGLGRREARAAASLKVTSNKTAATLKLSGSKVPGALGAEFGAYPNQERATLRRGKSFTMKGWNQFRPWNGRDAGAGYFLWPTIRGESADIINLYDAELERLLDRYFPVHGPARPSSTG